MLNSKDKRKMRKFIEELKGYRASHTEFITVYVPSGYDLNKVINQLLDEQGTASNIKSKSTKKNVQDALERMIQHLRGIGKTPPNGLAAFSGNVSAKEGQSDVKVWSLEPPEPLNMRLYRCDKEFVIDALGEMVEEKIKYGLVVMDRRDATLAILKGKSIIPLAKTHSEVPGKFKAGGQSAQRFARLREGAAKDHYRKVGEYMKEQFLNMEGLRGIIVGGPGPTKYEFVEGNNMTDLIKRKIIAVKDIGYTGEFGLQELVDRSQDVLANEEIMVEKKAVGKLFTLLSKEPEKVTYGIKEIDRALDMAAVDTLLISESIDDNTADKLIDKAEESGASVLLISMETREGVQLRDIGGIAAILRFSIE